MCLASRFARKGPNSQDKLTLARAGLSFKKIRLDIYEEKTVVDKKTSDVKLENNPSEILGYPKLKNAGGFELLKCVVNCCDLEVMNCPLSARGIRNVVGGSSQAKIHIWPIQESLSTEPLVSEPVVSSLVEKCKACGESVKLLDLRNNLKSCTYGHLSSKDEYFEHFTFESSYIYTSVDIGNTEGNAQH